jgi:ankyrin repeat protein
MFNQLFQPFSAHSTPIPATLNTSSVPSSNVVDLTDSAALPLTNSASILQASCSSLLRKSVSIQCSSTEKNITFPNEKPLPPPFLIESPFFPSSKNTKPPVNEALLLHDVSPPIATGADNDLLAVPPADTPLLNKSSLAFLLQNVKADEINRQDKNGNTPLMIALLQGNVQLAHTLIVSYADFDLQNHAGDTALMLAIKLKYITLAKEIVRYPCNISLVNKRQESAFFLLAQQGYRKTHQHFLLARAMLLAAVDYYSIDPNDKIDGNYTLLGLAVELEDLVILKKLIKKGASPDIVNKEGNTPLMLAIKRNNLVEFAALFLLTRNFNQQNQQGDTALMLAIRLGHIILARELIRRPLQLELVNARQENAFSLLACQGYQQTYQHFLLSREMITASLRLHSFSLNNKVDGNHTLLCLAAELGELLTINLLLTRGANPDIANSKGNTPLMVAIKQNNLSEALALLPVTKNLDQQNEEGDTALILAIRLGHIHIARALTQCSSDLLLINNRQENAFVCLAQQGYSLTCQHALLTKELIIALAQRYPLHIDHMVDGHHNLLCLAVLINDMEVAKILLGVGAQINMPNYEDNTPIMIALKQKQFEMFQFLLSKHPDLSKQNQQGESAYSLALENKWEAMFFDSI